MTARKQSLQNVADAVARLRAAFAKALAEGGEPSSEQSVVTDLNNLLEKYEGESNENVKALVAAILDPMSFPGFSRQYVIARAQRMLLKLSMEIEDGREDRRPREKKKSAEVKDEPVTPFDPAMLELDGVGPKTASRLSSRGLSRPIDLLFFLPRRYDDRRSAVPISELSPGRRAVAGGTVRSVSLSGRPWRRMMTVEVEDDGSKLYGVWFSNRRPSPDKFAIGERIYMAGLVGSYKNRLQIAHPTIIEEGDKKGLMGRIVPVYPEVPGVPGRTIEKAVRSAALRADEIVERDSIKPSILARRELMPLCEALRAVHLPPEEIDIETLERWKQGGSPAHRRLAYDEFFFVQLALGMRRNRVARESAPKIDDALCLSDEIGALLSLSPTAAQRRAILEIACDMAVERPMRRLLQGDVGSGKTLVALAAVVAAARSGLQTALMAPTEILAEQHMRTLYLALEKLGIRSALHIGQARAAQRRKTLAAIERGTVDVAIGTHALIQEAVSFRKLGLAIVDEQHRFGVSQRLGLVGKGPDGSSPHLLVMTATPIPRTLALTVHGDLDISILDELPPGRTPVKTFIWSDKHRGEAISAIAGALERGEQAFFVCPVIDESEQLDVRACESVFVEMCGLFGREQTGILHGRLDPNARESAMSDFSSGRISLLVATTVVEVGIDVPNATVMVIDGAERFGLAQLHQLRGRVGRSAKPSSCHLISKTSGGEAAARLRALAETNDGFAVAEADLAIRGPGEIYGRRQAGLPGFRYGHLIRDADLVIAARTDVNELLLEDPFLEKAENRGLCDELARRILADGAAVGEEAG